MTRPPRLTILFDNYPGVPGLTTLWGFAALIEIDGETDGETGGHRILFDTGSNGRALLKNMAALGVDPASVDCLFLSHPHWDHMGGLDSVLELNPHLTLVLHEGFSKHLIADLRRQCAELIVVGPEPRALLPGVLSTGMMDADPMRAGPPEHGLILNASDGATGSAGAAGVTAAISGCAHPGMERIVERGAAMLGKRIDWAIGGFHLMYADAVQIQRAIRAFQALDIVCVVPTHCTGDTARAAFRQAYGERCIEGGVGRQILIRPPHP